MNVRITSSKRDREAARDRKKQEKEERLRRNRSSSSQGFAAGDRDIVAPMPQLAEVKLEDINISGVAPRGPKSAKGPTKLFVGGLDWNTEQEQLKAAFSSFGPLREVTVVSDRYTGRSRGFGFVTFENPADAAVALKQMNGADLDGRSLRVTPADRD